LTNSDLKEIIREVGRQAERQLSRYARIQVQILLRNVELGRAVVKEFLGDVAERYNFEQMRE